MLESGASLGPDRPVEERRLVGGVGLINRGIQAAAAAALICSVVALATHLWFRAPTVRAAIETCLIGCSLVSGALLWDRFRRARRLADLVVLIAALTLALHELEFFGITSVLGLTEPLGFGALFGPRLIVATALMAAALGVRSARKMGRRESAPLIVATAMCVAGPGMAALLVNDHVYEEVGEPRVGVAHGAEIVLAIGVVGLVFSAAITFARACSRQHDATLGMIGTAAVLLGAAWTCDLVAPARGTQWVSGRELLRVLAYGCLAVAAVRRRSALQRAEQEKAVLDERRRLIDDLHDGLAQDLAFLVTQADTRLGTDDSVAVVARRALAGARGAIADLSAATAPTAAAALETIADELSARHGVDVTVDADDVALPPRERYAVTRIAREAIVNAVQHGAARRVAVSLAADDAALRLTVHDDGRGMGRAAADDPLRGYGLRAMRERAEAIHGRLIAASGTDGGTDIQLMVPRH